VFLILLSFGSLAALVALVLWRPMFLRGIAEAIGWLKPLSIYHTSGVYDFSSVRPLVYVLTLPLAGFAVAVYRRMKAMEVS
jgi:hypothetical protein